MFYISWGDSDGQTLEKIESSAVCTAELLLSHSGSMDQKSLDEKICSQFIFLLNKSVKETWMGEVIYWGMDGWMDKAISTHRSVQINGWQTKMDGWGRVRWIGGCMKMRWIDRLALGWMGEWADGRKDGQ